MTPASFDIQGHRGARGLYPENTIPGFLAALDLGIPTLEMDVVISRDERVVVSHDPWMARSICKKPDGSRIPILRERSLRIYEMPYREIAEYDCGTLPSKEFKEQAKIPAAKPLLLDVLESSERHIAETGRAAAFYSIETKSRPEWDGIYHPDPETFTRLLIAVLEDAGVTDRAIVQSFDVRTLRHVKRMNPSMRLSLLAGGRRARDLRQARDLKSNLDALGFIPDIYSPHHEAVSAELVDAARRQGIGVVPWTVNEANRIVELKELGVDGLITDYPDVAMRTVGT